MRRSLGKFWLCLPFLIIVVLDQCLTLYGQPAAYWRGRWEFADEGSPAFNWLLRQHPLAFVGGCLAWDVVFSGLILLLPRYFAKSLALALVIGHAWGSASW